MCDNDNGDDKIAHFAKHCIERAKSAADITPRKVLVEMLRRIDAGEIKPRALILAYDTDTDWGFDVSSPAGVISAGLASLVSMNINHGVMFG